MKRGSRAPGIPGPAPRPVRSPSVAARMPHIGRSPRCHRGRLSSGPELLLRHLYEATSRPTRPSDRATMVLSASRHRGQRRRPVSAPDRYTRLMLAVIFPRLRSLRLAVGSLAENQEVLRSGRGHRPGPFLMAAVVFGRSGEFDVEETGYAVPLPSSDATTSSSSPLGWCRARWWGAGRAISWFASSLSVNPLRR